MERWERGVQTGGFPLADGTSAKALTGIDDHSRMCVRHPTFDATCEIDNPSLMTANTA